MLPHGVRRVATGTETVPGAPSPFRAAAATSTYLCEKNDAQLGATQFFLLKHLKRNGNGGCDSSACLARTLRGHGPSNACEVYTKRFANRTSLSSARGADGFGQGAAARTESWVPSARWFDGVRVDQKVGTLQEPCGVSNTTATLQPERLATGKKKEESSTKLTEERFDSGIELPEKRNETRSRSV